MLDLNWEGWIKDGTIDANEFRIVGETDRFDHCVFTVRQALDPSAEKAWLDALFAMRYDNPAHREMMDLEGLKAWLPGRTTGFGPLTAAVDAERFFAASIVVSIAAALSRHDRRQLAAAARASPRRSAPIAAVGSTARSSIASPTRRSCDLLRLQESLGCDIVTDGELRRDNFYSFVAEKLVRRPAHDPRRDARRRRGQGRLRAAPPDARRPRLFDQQPDLRRRASSGASRWRSTTCAFARRHTDRPIKVTLPGPYLLTRAMFVPELTRAYYPDKEALAEDVVALLRAELEELRSAGADFVQFDEPVLTEVAFAPGRTRTFMCAALAARRDPAEELEFAVSLINRVVAGVDGLRIGLHVCRGNWSRDETTLLSGGYQALRPYLERLQVTQLVLEYATERAGTLVAVRGQGARAGRRQPSHRPGRDAGADSCGRRRGAPSLSRRTRVPES